MGGSRPDLALMRMPSSRQRLFTPPVLQRMAQRDLPVSGHVPDLGQVDGNLSTDSVNRVNRVNCKKIGLH